MSYPGFAPNFKIVEKTGGYTRNCIVIELQTIGGLDKMQLALIQEQLEMTIDKIKRQIPVIENTHVILQDKFDSILCDGLRLPRV